MTSCIAGIFSESAARGLMHHAASYPGFLETARFVTFITNIWKIMSVKASHKG